MQKVETTNKPVKSNITGLDTTLQDAFVFGYSFF
jgi:hypothetical protein